MTTFVLEAAERGALDRRRGRIVGIDLDDPAEAVGFVRFLLDVEAVDMLRPGVPGRLGDAIALVGLGIGHLLGIAAEVAVEILFRRQPGAPRRLAAGAVVQHAQHLAAGRIGRGLEFVVAGRRAGDFHRRRSGNSPSILAVGHDLPLAALAGDLDDCTAVRRHLDLDLGLGCLEIDGAARSQPGEHQAGIRVFVVHDHQKAITRRTARRQWVKADIVAIIAELLLLGGSRQVAGIEGRRTSHHRIAPADQDLRFVAFGNVMRLVEPVRDLLEGERRRAGRLGQCGVAQQFVAESNGGTSAEQAAQRIAAPQPSRDQLADCRLGAGVRADVFGVDEVVVAGSHGTLLMNRSPI